MVSVHDDDTLTVLVGKQQVKVRLAEVDAPELRQPYGQRSRQSLAELCFQETAHVEMIARDRYGRGVGKVECAGKDAGAHQVSAGMAWVYTRYAPKDSPLYGMQAEAKAARPGLWADNEPVPPWECGGKNDFPFEMMGDVEYTGLAGSTILKKSGRVSLLNNYKVAYECP